MLGAEKVNAQLNCDAGYYCPTSRRIDEYNCKANTDPNNSNVIWSCYLDWVPRTLDCDDPDGSPPGSKCQTRNVCSSNDCTPVYTSYGTISRCDPGPTPCSPAGCCTLSGGGDPPPASALPSVPPSPGCTPVAPGPVNCVSPSGVTVSSNVNVELFWQWPGGPNWGDSCGVNSNQFRVQWDDSGPAFPTPNYNNLFSSIFSNTYVDVTPSSTIHWRVRAENGAINGPWTTCSFNTPSQTLYGTVYYSDNLTCDAIASNKINTVDPSLSVSVEAFDGLNTLGVKSLTDSGYSYDVGAGTGSYGVDIDWNSTGYVCAACGGPCTVASLSVPADNPVNFFLTDQVFNAWWQAEGGDVYSGIQSNSVTIQSLLPSNAYYLLNNDLSGTSPLAMRRAGTLNVGLGDLSQGSQRAVSQYRGDVYNYVFWKTHLGLPTNPSPIFGGLGSLDYDTISEVAADYYYVKGGTGSGDSNVELIGNWTAVNGARVIMVDDNLVINTNVVVPNGSFLIFIVNGTVTIQPGADSVQAMIVADGNITVEYDNQQLDYQGSLISWSDVILNRELGDFGPGSNEDTPSEKFTYRADFLSNMPDSLKIFDIEWQEVAPGSF